MKTFIIIAVIVGVLWFIIKAFGNRSSANESTNNTTAPVRSSGCKTSAACQHMDTKKAKEAGCDATQVVFCRACGDFLTRTDNCPNYYPRGCDSGICSFADNNRGGQCYCKLYNQTVSTRDSCPDYKDFFETDMGKTILQNLRK